MGGIVDAIFGGDDQETVVTYNIPPEASALQRAIVEELQALRPLAERAVPDVQRAIQSFIQQYQEWLQRSPAFFGEAQRQIGELTTQTKQQLQDVFEGSVRKAGEFWDEARQTLLTDIREAEEKIPQIYEQARTQTKELTKEVLQDALRNTIRKLAMQGLISQTAGTQAMAEQFRQYEYEPLQRLIEAETGAKQRLQEQALGYKTNIGEKKAGAKERMLSDYAGNIAKTLQSAMALQAGLTGQQLQYQLSLPDIYRAIMQAQQQYTLTPFELRRSLLGTLTGSAGVVQQLSPANVTQATSGGVNPVLGGLVGTAGTLGLFKLFGLI
jgi:hypothetical protein